LFIVCLGILPINVLYLKKSNPLYYSFLPFPLPCIIQQFSMRFIVSCSHTDVKCFNIIHFLSFFSSFPPPLVSSNSPTTGNMFWYMCIYDNACICIHIYLPHMRENMLPLAFLMSIHNFFSLWGWNFYFTVGKIQFYHLEKIIWHRMAKPQISLCFIVIRHR
jgi:hypothetical protein